ncbi:unnamed protein product [Brachionus calyciflorus]|uniref:TLC domain-containing protein n=1 Tax=Brachionus calyciflorus TaxID=104777 RepID=A0A813NQS0_9BILA|nr:unnamed protein product [Brachionus calyciflorus]
MCQSETIYLFCFNSILFATLFYSLLNVFRKNWRSFSNLDRNFQIKFMSNLISSIHAVVIVTLICLICATDQNFNKDNLIYRSNALILTYSITFGYFVYDFFLLIYYKNELFDWQYIAHHTVGMVAGYTTTNYGYFSYLMTARLISEASTIFINFRWFLLVFKLKDSKLYTLNGILVLVIFGLVRIVPIIPLWMLSIQMTYDDEYQLIPLVCRVLYFSFKQLIKPISSTSLSSAQSSTPTTSPLSSSLAQAS